MTNGYLKAKWEWLKNVFRFTYSLPFVLASVTGVSIAYMYQNDLMVGLFIVLDVFILSLFVNLSNDYFDHKSGADSRRFFSSNKEFEKKAREILNPKLYWSGNAFDLGIITESQGKFIMAMLASFAILLSIPIIIKGGIIVIVLGLVAFFLSYFYTAPPLNLGARGLGEVDVFLSFFMISFFSFFVLTSSLSEDAFLVAISIGLLMMTMRIVDEMNGYEAHVNAGERDLCVRLGLKRTSKIVILMMVAVYCTSIFLAIHIHLIYTITLITIPISVKIAKTLFDRNDPYRFVRPALFMFVLSFSYQLLLIIASIARIFLTSG